MIINSKMKCGGLMSNRRKSSGMMISRCKNSSKLTSKWKNAQYSRQKNSTMKRLEEYTT